ncbi:MULTISPECIES: GntR family transcriptional regulator [Rhodomicrobium]|uniref:GntR family transcriptional regulator n=1 Tax=Rhodomicrobium TaxID=1068 RepID=UPI000B4B4178|nr:MULTISPECIES: GntR family transcriptional regulator [Rhodomicrobium]
MTQDAITSYKDSFGPRIEHLAPAIAGARVFFPVSESMSPVDHAQQDDLLSDDVYRRLKDYILCDVIRPPERLQIGQLSRHFGMSITPIREALIRLAAEHLIDPKPGRGFFYKEFIPTEQNKILELLFCLLKCAVETRSRKPFQFPAELTAPPLNGNGHTERLSPGLAAAIAREKLYRHLVLPLGNDQFTELVGNLCERTRISRILWLECADSDLAAEELDDWVRLFQAGENQAALEKLQKRFQAKTHKMHALASTRQHKIYEAYPLLRPGSSR